MLLSINKKDIGFRHFCYVFVFVFPELVHLKLMKVKFQQAPQVPVSSRLISYYSSLVEGHQERHP